LHQSERGGFLSVHSDFARHAKQPTWSRRVNVLLFLNENWQPEFGGDLEFWDRDVARCVTRIAPAANRCVIFPTNEYTYHGHPKPLACPAGVTRKSLALYYYTNEQVPPPSRATTYRALPGDPPLRRRMIAIDNWLLRVHSFAKRRLGLTDARVSALLKRLWR
jgi:hypothetical protein